MSDDPRGPTAPASMRVSAYDRVASLLVALLVIIGFAVSVLVLLWLARRAMEFNRPVPVEFVEDDSERDDPALGAEQELEPPGVEELAELERPQLAETLAAVTEAVSSQAGALDESFGSAEATGRGRGRGDRRGLSGGGEEKRDVVPRWERLKVKFSVASSGELARQLDFFGIELCFATVEDGEVVGHYASKLSTPSPVKRKGKAQDETRFRQNLERNNDDLADFHRELLAKAGIGFDAGKGVIAQFYPPQAEGQLLRLEKQHSNDRPLEEIRRTTFGVKAVGDQYEFYVISQEYRQPLR